MGECWEIKDKIGEKKFQGARNFGGNFWGKCKKKGGKAFLGGVLGELLTPTNFRGGIFGKMSKKKFRGEIFGGSTKGACDAVGMVHNEKKGKIKKKNLGGIF